MKIQNLLISIGLAATAICGGSLVWGANERHMHKAERLCRDNPKGNLPEHLHARFGKDVIEARGHDCKIPFIWKITNLNFN